MTATNSCIFCSIRDGELPAAMVYEDGYCLAFLDRSPLFEGHVLLVPRAHIVTIMDVDEELAAPFMRATSRLSTAVQTAMNADGIFTASNNLVSQSVAHLHMHIVPRNKKDGLRGFMWPRRRYERDDVMMDVAAKIRGCVP